MYIYQKALIPTFDTIIDYNIMFLNSQRKLEQKVLNQNFKDTKSII